MKNKFHYATGIVAIALILPAAADVIYSGLQNIAIPTNYDGVTVSVAGGTINPFFGGVGVANNNLLQPLRVGSGNLDKLEEFAVGSTIDARSMTLSTGYGGSVSHLGSTFIAGQEGYIGFKLNAADFGWMRVVFTNNTGGALIKDWAYDTSAGAGIVTGNVLQSAAYQGTQTVTLTSASGSFTLGSAITNTGGNVNSVVKEGLGTATLGGTNSYSGSTSVVAGTLLVNGSITGNGAVGVATGATLGGTGSIASAVNVLGTLAPGVSIGNLALEGNLHFGSGATFACDVNAAGNTADFLSVTGSVSLDTGAGPVHLAVSNLELAALAPNTTLTLMNYAGTYSGGFFTCGDTLLTPGQKFSDGHNTWTINYEATSGGFNVSDAIGGSFINLSNLTAIPEPGSMLALGCLIGVGAFMRSRRSVL